MPMLIGFENRPRKDANGHMIWESSAARFMLTKCSQKFENRG